MLIYFSNENFSVETSCGDCTPPIDRDRGPNYLRRCLLGCPLDPYLIPPGCFLSFWAFSAFPSLF